MPVWAAVITSATIVSDTAPVTPGVGQMWWTTTTGILAIWDSAQWVQVNVEEAPQDGQKYVRQDATWVLA